MLEKILYQGFKSPLKYYFFTLLKNEVVFDWIIPIFFGIVFYFNASEVNSLTNMSAIFGSIISLLAIFIGFSITSTTILLGSNNEEITWMKKENTHRKINGYEMSFYNLIYTTFIAAVIIELFVLFFNLGMYFSFEIIGAFLDYKRILISIDVIFLLNIFLLNIRNITNLYLLFWPKKAVS